MKSINSSISSNGLTHLLPSYIINELEKINKNNILCDSPEPQKCDNKNIPVSN